MHSHSRRAAFAAACFLATPSSGRAQLPAEPLWWSAPGTGIWAAGPVNVENARPLNVGQLKHVASQARNYLDNVLQPWGGAGTAITTLITQFKGNSTNPSTPVAERAENAAPVNVGQLKQVAELYYDRLAEMGLDAGSETASRLGGTASPRPGKSYMVPWQNNLPATENNSIATIGQLKLAFGFKVDLASIAPSYLVSNFAGYPYSSEVPVPPAEAALVRETLGDSAFGNAVPSLAGVPQWLLNGNAVNLGALAVTSEPVGGLSYKFVRLPKASSAPYQNVPQQRLELLLPLSGLNALLPAKYSRLNYAKLEDDAPGDVELVPRNRFLYLQYRFRTLPAEPTDGELSSIPVTGLRNRPGALIFCADDPLNNIPQGKDRFIAWEQRTAAAIASPYLAQKPISPLVEPFDYDSPQVAVATFPVASFVTSYPSSSELVMCRGWFDQLTFALPRPAISNNLLASPPWPAVSTLTWHTVTMKFDLKGDSGQLSPLESGAPVIYLDGRVSGVCDWLLDLVAYETGDGNLSVEKRDSTVPPMLHLRWNGTQAAPVDLCGFYVGLTNPLFEDVDHDGVPLSGAGAQLNVFQSDRTWFEGPREESNLGVVVNQQNKYDGAFNAWGSFLATWPVPSKSSLVNTYRNRGYGPGIHGPSRQEPGRTSRDPSALVPLGELVDSDGDFLPDAWELTYFPTLLACVPSGDPDGDFIPNSYEFHHQFNPTQNSYIPGDDPDQDGLTNAQERQLGFNYWELIDQGSQDPDGDGMSTAIEVAIGRDPFRADLPTNPPIILPEVNPYRPPSLDGSGLDQWLPPGTDRSALAFEDADEDGVEDDKDAVPYDANLTFAKAPESRYLVIPLMSGTIPEQGVPVAINNLGHILLQPVPAANTQAGNMDRLPARLWRSSSQVDNVPVPAAAENAPFPLNAPPLYLRDWGHSGREAWLDLAQDRPEVLGNALWVPLAAGVTYPSSTSAVVRVPNLSGFHGFVWDPVASPQGKWLPYKLPDETSAPVPHFLHSGTVDYSDCPASTARYLLAGGRITGSSLIHGQNLMQDPAYQNTREEYAFFSWMANPDGVRALTMNSPVFGKGNYTHKDSQNSDIVDVGYFKSLVPELLPESGDQSLFDATAQLGFKAFSWQGRAVLAHNPGIRPAPRRQDFPSDQAFADAGWGSESGTLGGGEGGGGRKNLAYYYCPDPWTNPGMRIPLPIVSADQVDPAALNDMPDQRGQKQSIRVGENNHSYYLPFSTGPFIVGGSGYWVADPASASTGGTEPFTKGPLIASPLIPADGAGQAEQPARKFFAAGNALGRQGVNKRGEIIGSIEGTASERAGSALWRNGRGHLLSNLLTSTPEAALYTNIDAKAINDNGLIAATAIHRQTGLRTPVILLPIEIKAFKRGTVNTPGAEVPAGVGQFGYETVMMENADSESSDSSTNRDCDDSATKLLVSGAAAKLNSYRKANDDDLVKIVLKWPAGIKPAGASLKLLHDGMQVNATQTTADAAVSTSGPSRLNFYKEDGTRIENPATDLQIADLAHPNAPATSYLSKILTDGQVTIFIEGADRFGDLPANRMDRLGGAQLKWEFKMGTTTEMVKLLVYRGGFLRFLQTKGAPGSAGNFEFRDGKGRIRHTFGGFGNEFKTDETDLGKVLATWTAKSGKTMDNPDYPGGPYNKEDRNGHTPPGWWRQYRSTKPWTVKQQDQPSGSGAIKKISQGGYVRWKQDDETDPVKRYTTPYRYNASLAKDLALGEPVPIKFKFDMEPIAETTWQGRSAIQIHPDGECNDNIMGGTAGCIGIQTYNDCKAIDSVLTGYHSLKVKVQFKP